ncbi:hypothetical protein, partial [Pantoea agglomerans]|uniref:hypothetical protein n=1 Tax=Enterobacter agglomerans TaxID=549 RepID=UPI001A8D614E
KRQGAFSCLYCLQEKCLIGEGKGNENYSVDYRDHFYRGLTLSEKAVKRQAVKGGTTSKPA